MSYLGPQESLLTNAPEPASDLSSPASPLDPMFPRVRKVARLRESYRQLALTSDSITERANIAAKMVALDDALDILYGRSS